MIILLLALPLLAADNQQVFTEKLQPLLTMHCASCHAGRAAQANLSVESLDGLLKGGKTGDAIVPGAAASSLLVAYLRGERQPRMPLGGSLDERQIATIAAAIDSMEKSPEKQGSRRSPLFASSSKANRDRGGPPTFQEQGSRRSPLFASSSKDPHTAWLYSKPKKPVVPAPGNQAWVRNPIDAFVLARLEAKQMTPAPAASRRVLIRRLYFDLLGVPPPPAEVEQFTNDSDPAAYTKLVERLLADPRYGERWARHWLDYVRFAESDGFAIDSERPTAWRYRDYVVRAFNSDKPYDLFIKEQLAGDDLRDKRVQDKDRSERLVALGYYRMGPWEADANSKKQLRQDFLNEVTATTSATFLGLTVGCAQCHNHKYDPLPTRDFYRFQAFFAATGFEEAQAPFVDAENPKEMLLQARHYEDATDQADEELERRREALKQRFMEMKNLKADDAKVAAFLRELNVQNAFFQEREDAIFKEPQWRGFLAAKDELRRLTELRQRRRPVAYAVRDLVPPNVPEVAETHILIGGDLAAKADRVEPGFPEILTGNAEPAKIPFSGGTSGRRGALADWIASADNPLTARVMANRIWLHHFGEGIVRTPSDFGRNGSRPTHPELLDWLAHYFIEKDWSVKEMHRLMLASNTYQQASAHPEYSKYKETDPNNELRWRSEWRRLDAESIRDTLLSLSGRLNQSRGGPGALLNVPDDVADGFEFFKWFPSGEQEQLRRTLYLFQRRSVVMPMMEVFDVANMSGACARRNVTTVAPQALTMMNGDLTASESKHFAGRVLRDAPTGSDAQIDRAFRLALARDPSARELSMAKDLFAKYPPVKALEHLGAVLFNLNEFLYLE